VGYYVNNEYTDADLIENPPDKPLIEKLQRNIMSDHPRCARAHACAFGRAAACRLAHVCMHARAVLCACGSSPSCTTPAWQELDTRHLRAFNRPRKPSTHAPPRVTKFPHDFDNPPAPPPQPVEGLEGAAADDDDLMPMDDEDEAGDAEGDDDEEDADGMEDL